MVEGFFSRHGPRVSHEVTGEKVREESTEYAGVAAEGVEAIRAKVPEIKEMIDSAPRNAVVFIGGASEEPRTKSTGEIYGDTLAEQYDGNADIVVITKKTIDQMRQLPSDTNTVHALANVVAQNQNKKIVISYPLFLKEFSLRPHFRNEKGENTPFNKAINEQVPIPETARAYIESEGKITTPEGELTAPSAQEIARIQLHGMKRLQDFAQKYAPDRPVLVGYVSHGWLLDAVASYLANEGRANVEGFEKTGNRMIEQPEIGKIEIKDGKTVFTYRDKQFDVPHTALEGI